MRIGRVELCVLFVLAFAVLGSRERALGGINGACCVGTVCSINDDTGCPAIGGVFQGPATACSPDPCAVGACCRFDMGTCQLTLAANCTAFGQTFHGVGSTCSPVNPCSGACCNYFTIACTIAGPECFASGVLLALGTTCSPDPCPARAGACCEVGIGACFIRIPTVCNPPLVSLGVGSTCTAINLCNGACCDNTNGACQIQGSDICRFNIMGTYLGDGTTCSPNPCLALLGACCRTIGIGNCDLSLAAGCPAPFSSFGGAGTTCMPVNPCAGACCASGACTIVGLSICNTNLMGTFNGNGSTCSPNPCAPTACCDTTTGLCSVVPASTLCPAGTVPGSPTASACSAALCPQPTACCNYLTGACSVVLPTLACPAGTAAAPAGASACVPYPCPFPGAAIAAACADCTYLNGAYDGRDGQLSHLGGAAPHGSKAADDFSLCDNFVYDVRTFSATLFTTTFPGLVKPKGEIWSDCNGCPGELLYTFENPLVIETGANIGPAFDGRPLRIVNVTFDVTRETQLVNRNVVLHGGRYWLSIYGQSDNLGPSMGMYDVTYWGTTGNGIAGGIKGKPAYKIDGNPGNPYNIYSFPAGCSITAWHSVIDDCCIGCTDLNFSFCTNPCKVLVDNGTGRIQTGGAANGSTSQFAPASWSAAETRSADDFVVPPCQDYHICYVEACVLTNCPTFDGVFELYGNNCNKPDYALHGAPLFNTQYLATKIIPLGPAFQSVIDGKTVQGFRLEFHDLNIILAGGRQYWISVGVRYTFSINERAFFCYNQYCDNRCPIKWNEGRVLTAQTLDDEAAAHGCVSAAPIVGCNGWAKTGNDFSFLIAADGLTTPGPINSQPGNTNVCRADINGDGTLNVQDVFDYLNVWFSGCP